MMVKAIKNCKTCINHATEKMKCEGCHKYGKFIEEINTEQLGFDGWVPLCEYLPAETPKSYLITYENVRTKRRNVTNAFCEHTGRTEQCVVITGWSGNGKILAWQPIPKAYKE